MKIKQHNITIRDLVEGYKDDGEGGVVGYGGKLDIRPPYQREFIYGDKQRDAVIDTVIKHYPLNVMYWADRGDGTFEVMDGQQRTISICQYVTGKFSHNQRYFHNLTDDEQKRILDYELMVYRCSGTDSEKLEWFKTINIAGEKLTDQELRNAVYSGPWVTDAKRYFSRSGGPAYALAGDYLNGSAIRQDYLETAIKWINDGDVEAYMAKHQHKPDATELWNHFTKVIDWVKATFPIYRKEMKGLNWGMLYKHHASKNLDPKTLEDRVAELMADEDVTNKKGIYIYVLDGDEKHLNIRAFKDKEKREAYQRQGGVCAKCEDPFPIGEMQADHIVPWSKGGKTVAENCQMLCQPCNATKSNK